jgi:hypothetical protein
MRPDANSAPSQGNLVRGFVPGTEFVLSGSYWEIPEGIKLTVTLARAGKGEIEGGTEIVIPKTVISLPTKPQNFSTAMADQMAFSENELLSSGLTVEVWTDRGAENVLYRGSDTMSVFVRVNMPCYIQMIYHLADGQRTLLYDSLYIDQSKVNKVVPIPQKFTCSEPFGAEVLQVLASTTGFNPVRTRMEGRYKVITDNLKTFLAGAKGMAPISATDAKPLQSEARLVLTTMPR